MGPMKRSKADRRQGSIPPLVGVGVAVVMLALATMAPQMRGPVSGRAEGAAPPRSKAAKQKQQQRQEGRAKSRPESAPKLKRSKKPPSGSGSGSNPPPTSTVGTAGTVTPAVVSTPWVVLGYNELGMHCMNQDFSELCILPPFNTLRAQVIKRGGSPEIIKEHATVSYSIPGNTLSSNKTNFWAYAQALFGVALPPDVGLTGHRLTGTMSRTGRNDWEVTGIPITPIMDDGTLNPYALARINVKDEAGRNMATTQAVVPVSWEISCNLCHTGNPDARPPISPDSDILMAHDRLHGTNLVNQKPVLCAGCHADPALGTPGTPGIPSLSAAMHGAHAGRFTPPVLQAVGGNNCYACHPGAQTQCQRDIHYAKGLRCGDCHGTLTAMGNRNRTPWVDEPKCASCHNVPGHQYEEPGKLFKESRGHNGVTCAACHGAPHAITPTVTAADNVQAMTIQGHAGTIDNCVVCHKRRPEDRFNHTRDDD
ncbi:MAG: hypothetical protein U0790_09010 [Isosphaeraceae bacterium]